jgi:hypothetical protein
MQGDKRMDAPPDVRAELQKSLFRDPNFIVLNALQPGAKLRGLKPTAEGAVSFDTLEVISPEGDLHRLLLDPKTHQLVRIQYVEEEKQARDDLSDYRVIDGVSFPFKLKHTVGDQHLDIVYDKITLNPKLAPDLFQ